MKYVFTSLILFFVNAASNAQEINNMPLNEIPAKYVILEFQEGSLFSKQTVIIDYGQITKFTKNRDVKKSAVIKENDKEIIFNSEIEAVNFLAKHGFKLIESYQNVSKNSNNEMITEKRKFLLENLNYSF